MVDYSKIIASSLYLDIDYEKMTRELLEPLAKGECVSFTYPPERSSAIEVTAYSLFLRNPKKDFNYSYRGSKSAELGTFYWNPNVEIPYTKHCIEKLPFSKLGTIRAVYFPDIPCVEHTDWDNPNDLGHTLGLSIIPNTGQVDCKVWVERLKTYVNVPGNAMLLNDSITHWVPKSTGTRIAVRIFGEIDYNYFDDKIIFDHCYSRD